MLNMNEIAEVLGVSRSRAVVIVQDEGIERKFTSSKKHRGHCYYYMVTPEQLIALKEKQSAKYKKTRSELRQLQQDQALARLETVFRKIAQAARKTA